MLRKNKKIGSGTFGNVYSASSDDQNYAIKRNFIESYVSWIGNIKELDFLTRLNHCFIVKLQKVSFGNPFLHCPLSPSRARTKDNQKDDKVHFILELADNTSAEYIYNMKIKNFYYIKLMICQLFLAIEHIHDRNIVHRDIKPGNILVVLKNDKPNVKLCDFGMSRNINNGIPMTPRVVTSWYRAPEICFKHQNYGKPSDVWSLGCTAFEFVSLGVPFINIGSSDEDFLIMNEILKKIDYYAEDLAFLKKEENGTPLKLNALSFGTKDLKRFLKLSNEQINEFNSTPGSMDDFIDLLRRIFLLNPNHRITVTDALNKHPFFSYFKEYIKAVRNISPPVKYVERKLNIVNSQKRTDVFIIAFNLFNNNFSIKSNSWFNYAILFHSLNLFDLFLEWERDNYSYNGNIKVQFYVCVYIMHKYFVTNAFLSWKDIFPSDLYSNEMEAEIFENFLIYKVLRYEVYYFHLLEALTELNYEHSEDNIIKILNYYARITEFNGTAIELVENSFR